MTKEELEKEAEGWLCNNLHSANEEDFIKAMVDIAEPREKRIAELERKLKVETELSNRLGLAYREYEELTKEQDEHLAELEKACEETQELLDKQIEATYRLDKENAELKERADKADLDSVLFFNQLCKAKKLLKKVVTDFHNMDCVTVHIDKTIAEAEQFLNNEVEK